MIHYKTQEQKEKVSPETCKAFIGTLGCTPDKPKVEPCRRNTENDFLAWSLHFAFSVDVVAGRFRVEATIASG